MRTLSIWQPWAWLIVNGWKNVENRPWRTAVRGPILIHAGSRRIRAEYDACHLFLQGFSWGAQVAASIPACDALEYGGIVGQATILDSVDSHASEWFCGPYALVLAECKPLPFMRCRGFQRWFDVQYRSGAG